MDIITLALAKKQIGKDTTKAVSDYLDEHLTNPTNPPLDTSLEIAGAAADSKATGDKLSELKEGLSDIDERVEALEDGGTGISDNAIDLLDQLGSHIAFTSAQGGQLWDDLIDELRNSTPSVMHTVTWTGSNYSSSNTATSTKEGRPYTTTISPNEGYVVSAVTASMGNEAITPTDNGDGTYTVSITSVTADIAISVTTQADTSDIIYHVENLVCDGTQAHIETPLEFGSLTANGVAGDWTLCTRASQFARADSKFVVCAGSDYSRLAIRSNSNGLNTDLRRLYAGVGDIEPYTNGSNPIIVTHRAGSDNTLTSYRYVKGASNYTEESYTATNAIAYLSKDNGMTPLCVGAKLDDTGAFVGTIEDVTIYNRILTAEEISAYMARG